MPARDLLLPLGPLAVRSLKLYVGLRLLLVVVSAIVMSLGGEPFDNPAGIVILSAALGLADLHRRHELLLWANLGYPPLVMSAIVASVAVVGETIWVLL